jgi:hypothetical protein
LANRTMSGLIGQYGHIEKTSTFSLAPGPQIPKLLSAQHKPTETNTESA